jgi:hypothetical protein
VDDRRIAQRKTLTGAPEPKVREMAHTLLEESLTRGGTVEERDAARAWLQTSTSDTAERCTSATAPANVEKQNTTFASAEPSPSSSRRRPAVSASRPSATKAPVGQTIMNGAGGLSSEQMDALTTQQQRILRRSTVIDCVLRAEDLDALTMRQAVRDLLEDIATATHRIGAIVQQATR